LNGLAAALLNNTPHNCRARLKGVLGAEVWFTLIDSGQPAYSPIIAALGNLAAMAFLTMATKPTLHADFRSGDGGTK